MILYQVISTYQLLNAIVHKSKYNSDKKCVLIISKWLTDKHPNYNELESFFNKVIVMDAVMTIDDTYIERNTDYCTKLLSKNKCGLNDISEIHAMGCHYNFGAFLATNNIPHYFWEDAAGLLSRPEILININKTGFPVINEFCEKHHLYDGSENGVIKKYCNFSAQKEGFDLSNAIDFDVVSAFLSLSSNEQLKIREFFTDAKTIDIDENSVLILTQQLFSLCVVTFEEQALIYQLFVDYFFPNEKVVFKTHPDDFMYYGLLFPNAEIIRKKFPAEFLPTLFTKNPKTIATISSTAIDNLKKHFDNCFVLGTRFEREFSSVHKYSIAVNFAKKHCSDYQVISIGAMENVINAFGKFNASSDKKFYFIDKSTLEDDIDIISLLENATSTDVFVFINSDDDYAFYNIQHKHLWQYIHPIHIKKHALRTDDVYSNEEQETFYLFTKSNDLSKEMDDFAYTNTLNNTGITVTAQGLSGEEKCLELLKALALATEHKLLIAEAKLKEQYEAEKTNSKKKKKTIHTNTFDESSIYNVRYSNPDLPIEALDYNQNQMRILEGIINATENRLIFYLKNGENI